MPQQILLKRSTAVDGSIAKAPSDLAYGELAINYAAGHEALYAKNSNNEIVDLLSNDKTTAALTTFVDNHIHDYNNPHNVTKAQVGLQYVDNTADADKPVSTALQTALDGKLDSSGGIVDNLTTNSTTQALSANQGIILAQKISNLQSQSSSDTQNVMVKLDSIQSRLNSVEEEIDGTEGIEDKIIAKEESMIAVYNQ